MGEKENERDEREVGLLWAFVWKITRHVVGI